jgi:hypothetical protein
VTCRDAENTRQNCRSALSTRRAKREPTKAPRIWCFIDNFRRRDHHGLAKALWFLFIVFVPVIGVFSYLVTRPAMVEVETVTE